MNHKITFVLFLALFLNVALKAAETLSLFGVTLPTKVTTTQQEKMLLNGYAVGSSEGVKMHVAALYVTKPQTNPIILLNSDLPMLMKYYFIKDDIDPDVLKLMLIENILINNKDWGTHKFARQQLQELQEALDQNINAGDVLTIYYSPQTGTSLLLNENILHQWSNSKIFFNMLLKTWIGEFPPSREFKRGILGIK